MVSFVSLCTLLVCCCFCWAAPLQVTHHSTQPSQLACFSSYATWENSRNIAHLLLGCLIIISSTFKHSILFLSIVLNCRSLSRSYIQFRCLHTSPVTLPSRLNGSTFYRCWTAAVSPAACLWYQKWRSLWFVASHVINHTLVLTVFCLGASAAVCYGFPSICRSFPAG